MNSLSWARSLPFYFEADDVIVDDDNTSTPTPTPTTPTPTPTVTFTQDDVNRFLAEEKRKAQKTSERTIKQLEELKKTAQLTQEEKEKLETRIEDIKNDFLSKEELAKKVAKQEAEKIRKQQEETIKDRDTWKERYINSTIDREILDAAGTDAFNTSQILDILRPKTRLVEELNEDNKPTGKLIPKIRFTGKDKDGNPVILDLTATEAVKQMKEIPESYGNLFRSGVSGGVGGNTTSNNRRTSGPPTGDAAAYRKWRKEHPNGV